MSKDWVGTHSQSDKIEHLIYISLLSGVRMSYFHLKTPHIEAIKVRNTLSSIPPLVPFFTDGVISLAQILAAPTEKGHMSFMVCRKRVWVLAFDFVVVKFEVVVNLREVMTT
jgi:hypothetical protein